MKPYPVASPDPPEIPTSGTPALSPNESQSFDTILDAASLEYRGLQSGAGSPTESLDEVLSRFSALSAAQFLETTPSSGLDVAATYPKNAWQSVEPAHISDFQKYRDDQLLRNPGGRNYYLNEKKVEEQPAGQSPWGLMQKDFSDAFGNIGKFFANMFLGTEVLYRNERNEIRQGRQRGLLQTVSDFCRDLGSALS